MRLLPLVLLTTALVLSTGCKDRAKAVKEKAALEEIEKSSEKLKQSMRDGLTEDGLVVDHDALQDQQDAIRKAGEQLGGKQGEALKIIAAIQGEANEYALKIEKQTEGMLASLDWETLATEGDYEARRKTLRDHITFNREVVVYFEGRPAELAKRLDAIEFSGKDRKDLESGFSSSFGKMLPTIREIRECDITACEIGIRALDLLEREKDKWSWNAEGGFIEIENEAASQEFEKEMNSMVEVGERQIQLQQRMIQEL